jgi:hypothetical protein
MEENAMKRALAACILATCGGAWAAPAQGASCEEEEARLNTLRQEIRSDRGALVARHMELTEREAEVFRPLYAAYEKELAPIVARQTRSVLDYVNVESRMTNANAARLVQEYMGADTDEAKLRASYARRVAAALNAKKAMRFLQIENKIRTLARYDTASVTSLVK